MKAIDLTGYKINHLTVIRRATEDEYARGKGKHAVWLCQCDCGNKVFKHSCDLRNGKAISCGCVGREKAKILAKILGEKNRANLVGKKFGKLTVLSLHQTGVENSKNFTEWKCQCECGAITYVRTDYLTSGHTTSCGCNKVFNNFHSPSKGEEKIANILKTENIHFEREKTFQDLHKGMYRYDFYLPELNIACEYDGKQHFEHIVYFHKSRQDFLKAQERDRKKNSYALSHNIPLYRIPYFEIENINTFQDILQDKFLVKDKWHCDNVARLLSK